MSECRSKDCDDIAVLHLSYVKERLRSETVERSGDFCYAHLFRTLHMQVPWLRTGDRIEICPLEEHDGQVSAVPS